MPYEDSLRRAALISRARRAEQPGQVRQTEHSIRRADADPGPLARENLLVEDQTGVSILGWGTMEDMVT